MFMNAPHFRDELELHRLDCLSSNGMMDNWQFVRDFMDSYRNAPLVPPPLLTGRDLVNLGLSPGPDFWKWLSLSLIHILAEKVVDGTLKLVKWNDAVEQWIRRLNGLSVWMPELELWIVV